MRSGRYEGEAAQNFLDKNLVRESVDSTKWQAIYKDRQTGDLWLKDWLYSEMQGGGTMRLRLLPLGRQDLIELLVLTGHLDVEQRQQLGTRGVQRSEVGKVILKELTRSGWYPANARPWPCNGQLYEGCVLHQVNEDRVELWTHRHGAISADEIAEQRHKTYNAPSQAIQGFISGEWPLENIDGISLTAD
ncbi:MAG: hypothetical protein ACRYFU_00265 [Janthinobacterium lividum]